jgi:catechol 2,3-dioxygenase-like lactoylglutathione lyase family enzyme
MSDIIGWDHIVLRGRDVEAALHFYGDVLGMEKLRVWGGVRGR